MQKLDLVPLEVLEQFRDCVASNPYFAVRTLRQHRMELALLDLNGLAIICDACVGANIADNICFCPQSRPSAGQQSPKFEDFTSHLSKFDAEHQVIFLINLCWGLCRLGWNVENTQRCEASLQAAYGAVAREHEDSE
jgi:hypothetical protein